MFSKLGLYVGPKIFVSSQWDYRFGGLKFVFLVILSEVRVQCLMVALYRQGSNTSLVHFRLHVVLLKIPMHNYFIFLEHTS
jgi:hypothetical protein